jgi:TldD protein
VSIDKGGRLVRKIGLSKFQQSFSGHTELRVQENRDSQIVITNGKIEQNTESSKSGVSSRVYESGAWGFASTPESSDSSILSTIKNATENAHVFAKKSQLQKPPFLVKPIVSEESFLPQKAKRDRKEIVAYLLSVDGYLASRYPDLKSRRVFFRGTEIEKCLLTSFGTKTYSLYPRAHIYVFLTYEKEGESIEDYEIFGGFGYFEDLFGSVSSLYPKIDALYQHLKQKAEGVYPKPGYKEVIVCPSLGGILAHEAVGHTTEADFVLGGSVSKGLLEQRVADESVTMVDFAHHYNGELLPVPVFVDDEGTEAVDAVLIDNGILKGYMHNLESAQELGMAPTGNARGFLFSDEPLIRMRNTAILPGHSTVDEMIASIEEGYYLAKTMNGQADSTGEFMFGIIEGYEIKNGKLGRALKDFTVSGVAFEMLKTVSMISKELEWENSGYCGKKQPMIVASGSPAIKCKMLIGGRE